MEAMVATMTANKKRNVDSAGVIYIPGLRPSLMANVPGTIIPGKKVSTLFRLLACRGILSSLVR